MPHLRFESELAQFVLQRACLSLCLVEGLRSVLLDMGRPDMAKVVELIGQNASEARGACLEAITNRKMARQMAVEMDLDQIEALGGPGAKHAAIRLASNLHSGAHLIFSPSKSTP